MTIRIRNKELHNYTRNYITITTEDYTKDYCHNATKRHRQYPALTALILLVLLTYTNVTLVLHDIDPKLEDLQAIAHEALMSICVSSVSVVSTRY